MSFIRRGFALAILGYVVTSSFITVFAQEATALTPEPVSSDNPASVSLEVLDSKASLDGVSVATTPILDTPIVLPVVLRTPETSPAEASISISNEVLMSASSVDAQVFEEDLEDKKNQDGRDFLNIVKQTTDYTCGPAALATLINLMGGKTEEMEMARFSGTTEDRGTTMLGLKNAAKEFGYNGIGKKIKFNKITKESLPFIVRVAVENEETKELKDHFVVLKKIERDNFFLADPVEGNVILKERDFEKMYKGSIFSVSMTKNSEILDPITGEMVKLKNLSQESALALIEEMSDDEMNLESGKFAALLRLLPETIRAVIASTSFKVTASFVSDLAKYPDRLKAYSKIGVVAKKGKLYYDVTSNAMVKIYDDYLIMYGKDSNALMNAYKISEKTLKSKLKQGHWIKK